MPATVYTSPAIVATANRRQFPLSTNDLATLIGALPSVTWSGPAIFTQGPWADVTGYGAVSGQESSAGIQAAIDYQNTNHAGGFVFFPPGTYFLNKAVTVKGGVILLGSGSAQTALWAKNQDSSCMIFDASCSNAGARDLWLLGFNSSLATTDAVTIATNAKVHLRDCICEFGRYAYNTAGVDCRNMNSFMLNGAVGNVLSSGANYYVNCAFNSDPGSTTIYAFKKTNFALGAGNQEDQIVQGDFSGPPTAVHIDVTVGNSLTKFVGCVMGGSIEIVNHGWTVFSECEVGASYSLTAVNPITFVGCNNLGSPVTLSGGNILKAANFNIS